MTMPPTIPADVKVLAVVVVRDGQLPTGASETVAETGGAVLIAGSGAGKAAGDDASSLRFPPSTANALTASSAASTT